MPSVARARAFLVLWWTTGLILLYASVRTTYHGLSTRDVHAVLLASLEALAALLFLAPRTMKIGALALLVILAVAVLIHAASLEFRGDLLVYGAVVAYVAVHGAVPVSWRQPRG